MGFGNANRIDGFLSTWSAFQLPPRHRKRGIAAKRRKKRKKGKAKTRLRKAYVAANLEA